MVPEGVLAPIGTRGHNNTHTKEEKGPTQAIVPMHRAVLPEFQRQPYKTRTKMRPGRNILKHSGRARQLRCTSPCTS